MLPYTSEENAWLSRSRENVAPNRQPLLTSEEVAVAIRRGRQLRAEAMVQLPGQIRRAVRSVIGRLADHAGSRSAARRHALSAGPEGFARR